MLWHGLLTVPRVLTEGLHEAAKSILLWETCGREKWHGQETSGDSATTGSLKKKIVGQ
jgi:hypothetical protein